MKLEFEKFVERMKCEMTSMPITAENMQRLDDDCAKIVRECVEMGKIEVWKLDLDRSYILLYDMPLDILPMIPLCRNLGLSEFGTYTVMQNNKKVGCVEYGGRPEQDGSGDIHIGIITRFMPEAPME